QGAQVVDPAELVVDRLVLPLHGHARGRAARAGADLDRDLALPRADARHGRRVVRRERCERGRACEHPDRNGEETTPTEAVNPRCHELTPPLLDKRKVRRTTNAQWSGRSDQAWGNACTTDGGPRIVVLRGAIAAGAAISAPQGGLAPVDLGDED